MTKLEIAGIVKALVKSNHKNEKSFASHKHMLLTNACKRHCTRNRDKNYRYGYMRVMDSLEFGVK